MLEKLNKDFLVAVNQTQATNTYCRGTYFVRKKTVIFNNIYSLHWLYSSSGTSVKRQDATKIYIENHH